MNERVARALRSVGTPTDVLMRHNIAIRKRMACCPFHEDRHPSLSLYTSSSTGKPRWRCHGCGIGGDALDLEARLRGITLKQAIDLFADGVLS